MAKSDAKSKKAKQTGKRGGAAKRGQAKGSKPDKPAEAEATASTGRETKPQPTPGSTNGGSGAKPRPDAEQRRPSGLDAAAVVLLEAKVPMSAGDIMKEIAAKGLWQSSGKTPAATLSAAMLREIQTKGEKSRFQKTGRGLFVCK